MDEERKTFRRRHISFIFLLLLAIFSNIALFYFFRSVVLLLGTVGFEFVIFIVLAIVWEMRAFLFFFAKLLEPLSRIFSGK